MSSIDDQSSLLARLLPAAARLSLLTWSRSMASTTQRLVGPRSYVMLYGYLISAEQCISHGQLGSGRAWSGLQLATFSVDSTHIKIDGRQQCLCLCLYECIYVCVCVESLERLTKRGGRRGEWCLCVPKNTYRPVKITDNV